MDEDQDLQTPPPPVSMPVILHSSLTDSEITKILQQYQLKVRISETIPENGCIFPTSSLAFLILPLTDAYTERSPSIPVEISEGFIVWIEKALQIHRHCVLLGLAGLHGPQENTVWSVLQERFLFSHLQMIPVHNAQECAHTMITMAQGTTKAAVRTAQQWLSDAVTRQLSGYHMQQMYHDLKLSQHQQFVLEDGLGGLGRIANASKEELLDCSLDSSTADAIIKYFQISPKI